jgi:hypothetical protein
VRLDYRQVPDRIGILGVQDMGGREVFKQFSFLGAVGLWLICMRLHDVFPGIVSMELRSFLSEERPNCSVRKDAQFALFPNSKA